jgi:hypothetical protein
MSDKYTDLQILDFVEILQKNTFTNERKTLFESTIQKLRADALNPELEFYDSNQSPEFIGVAIGGKLMKPSEIDPKEGAIPLQVLSPVTEGDYLYRAPNTMEWESIVKHRNFLVALRTNFEITVAPQVSMYAQQEGYAGVVIRIKVPGPYYRNAGLQVPRIESILPHYAEVEVLNNGEWTALDSYLDSN